MAMGVGADSNTAVALATVTETPNTDEVMRWTYTPTSGFQFG